MKPGPLSGAAVLVMTLFTRAASASDRDVVLVGGGGSFREALSVAVGPWSLRVVGVDTASPSADVARATREAKAIALRHAAAGVVWVANHDGEHALLVYDAATEQLVSRVFPQAPPFDAPTAAAAALSVKTLLRSSTVAPEAERLGAPEGGAAPSPSAGATGEGAPQPPSADPPVTIELGAAVRAIASEADTRVGLGAAAWFGRLGLGLAARSGPGLTIDAPGFRGRFDELSIGVSARYRLALGAHLRLEPRVGATMHATRIDGVALPTGAAADESRLDMSADAGCVLDLVLHRAAAIGLDLEGAWVLRYQRYLVGAAPVLTLAPVQGSAGLRLAVGFP